MQEAVMFPPSGPPLDPEQPYRSPSSIPPERPAVPVRAQCLLQTDGSFSVEKSSPFACQAPDVKSECPLPLVPGTAVGALLAPRQAPGRLAETRTGLQISKAAKTEAK